MLTCDPVASAEGISLITLVADTNRHVVPDPAVGIDATQSRTRILTLSVDAGLVRGTVRVDHTFWSAVWWRAYHPW